MEDFKKAQKLFDIYQKAGGFQNLVDSLDVLDEIIDSQGPDTQRADNLKQTIRRHINAEIKKLFVKTNVYEFIKHPNGTRLFDFLAQSLGTEDAEKFSELFVIKELYFK